MKGLVIFGSTGSIGTSALSLLSEFKERFRILGLSGRSNLERLRKQAETFKVPYLVVEDSSSADWLRSHLSYKAEILVGDEGLRELAACSEAEVFLIAISGLKALIPAYYALKNGKRVALANKESIISAGALLKETAKTYGGEIIPVDSEHSALFQLLSCEEKRFVRTLILTASGGPFLNWSLKDFHRITPELALKHPTWQMGPKITIDSATLMNKGFEVLEAVELFGFSASAIKVIIHPQSIIHSLIELSDGSLLAHLSQPDMKIPIAYALSYPERWELPFSRLSLAELKELTFREVDFQRFPCLKLAFEAAEKGFPYPLVLEAADEVLVSAFLEKRISFLEIPRLLEKTLNEFKFTLRQARVLEDYLNLHQEVRAFTEELIEREGLC
jgi:1-deoxy-D-xylulose-5-phosphate reductoisomerase